MERTTFAPELQIDLTKMARRRDGLYVQDLIVGNGAIATVPHTVVVRFTGYLPNGKVFDSGEISVALGARKVIRAWEEGLLGMRVGGKRRIVSPPNLAYGSHSPGDPIPDNAVLVFDMELVSVNA